MDTMPGGPKKLTNSGSGLVEGVGIRWKGMAGGHLLKRWRKIKKGGKKGFLILFRMWGSKPLNEYLEASTVIFICSNCSAKTGRCSTCHRERRRFREGKIAFCT